MPDLNYSDVEPIGTDTVWGHQNKGDDPHVWGAFKLPRYPDSDEGKAHAQLRRKLGLYLHDVASILDLTVLQAGNLERGAGVCDWSEADRRLRAAVESEASNG